MLQNPRVTIFNVTELLRENQMGKENFPLTNIRVKSVFLYSRKYLLQL